MLAFDLRRSRFRLAVCIGVGHRCRPHHLDLIFKTDLTLSAIGHDSSRRRFGRIYSPAIWHVRRVPLRLNRGGWKMKAAGTMSAVGATFFAIGCGGGRPVRLGRRVGQIIFLQFQILFCVGKIRWLHDGFCQRRRAQNIAPVFADHLMGRSRGDDRRVSRRCGRPG